MSDGIYVFQNMQIDKFVKKYLGNELGLKKELYNIQTGQKSM